MRTAHIGAVGALPATGDLASVTVLDNEANIAFPCRYCPLNSALKNPKGPNQSGIGCRSRISPVVGNPELPAIAETTKKSPDRDANSLRTSPANFELPRHAGFCKMGRKYPVPSKSSQTLCP